MTNVQNLPLAPKYRVKGENRLLAVISSLEGKLEHARELLVRELLTGLRREQARSQVALEEIADLTLPNGVKVRKLSPFADWTTREV